MQKGFLTVILASLSIILMLALFGVSIIQSMAVETSPKGCKGLVGCFTILCDSSSTTTFDVAQLLTPYRFDIMQGGKNVGP
jgi:hypothetical protein